MKPKRAVKEHEKALKRDPENVTIRIKLAGALQQCGRTPEAAQMYLSVARGYADKGRINQAIAVCKSVLEIAPGNAETEAFIEKLEGPPPDSVAAAFAESAAPVERPSQQSFAGPTPLPAPLALHDAAEETGAPASRAPKAGAKGGVDIEFRGPPPLPPAPGAREDVHEAQTRVDPFPHKKLEAKVSFRRPKRSGRRKPRNRAAEAAAELAKELETETQGRAISPRLPQALTEIASGMQLKQFPRGEMILREGDPGNALYLIVSGRVRVLKNHPEEPDADLVEIATLGEGEIFGEFALLADFRRHATVQSVGDTHVYEIPRALVDELTKTYPEMAEHLEGFYRERLLNSLLDTSSFFKALPGDLRAEVLKKFKPIRVQPEKLVVHEGEVPAGFYIVLLGEVDVLKATGPQTMNVVATLREGDHFGATALLRGHEATSSVMSRGPTELARLPVKDFYSVVAANPVLWDQLRTQSLEREQRVQDVLASA